jgi:hypothetical protein
MTAFVQHIGYRLNHEIDPCVYFSFLEWSVGIEFATDAFIAYLKDEKNMKKLDKFNFLKLYFIEKPTEMVGSTLLNKN